MTTPAQGQRALPLARRDDDQGRPEARVVPPKRIVAYAADADGLWAVEEDALDVPFVVHYRIDRARN